MYAGTVSSILFPLNRDPRSLNEPEEALQSTAWILPSPVGPMAGGCRDDR